MMLEVQLCADDERNNAERNKAERNKAAKARAWVRKAAMTSEGMDAMALSNSRRSWRSGECWAICCGASEMLAAAMWYN